MGEISVRLLGNMNQTEGHETELRLPQGCPTGAIYCQFQLTQNRLLMAGVRSQPVSVIEGFSWLRGGC
jgi:hypothetical protein